MAEPYYCTANDLRTELGVNSTALPDADAIKLIEFAEDITDDLLGGWIVDDTTGRKIVQANVDAGQWRKLGRFTKLFAAKLYTQPGLADGRQWTSESGPDFAHSGPVGSPIGAGLLSILNASGLRRIGGRATPGTRSPLVEAFFGHTPQSWRF